MITSKSTLADICFAVSEALAARGIAGVLTGGSAAAVYAPQAYMSDDADFILDHDEPLSQVAEALESVGFRRMGRARIFDHPDSDFTLDFPKGPLSVGGDYVHETALLTQGDMRLRILTRFDCVRDRLAHFYFWDDYTALNAAVAVAAQSINDADIDRLRSWTERESPSLLPKFEEFRRRLSTQSSKKQPPS